MNEQEVQQHSDEAFQTVEPDKGYRALGQPPDTISGTTKELFEVRGPAGDSPSSTAFKVIAFVAIVAVVVAIAVTQFGLLQ